MRYGNNFDEMIGRTVAAVYAKKGGTEIGFDTDLGYIEYGCEGYCCSSSWFEHISGVDNLIGQKIVETKNIDLPEPPEEDSKDHECLQNYGYRLVTTSGFFEVEMRNSSNAYYGGNITGPSKGTTNNLKVLKEDF